MAWRRPGAKPLSEPRMENLLTHICVTRPPWVTLTWMRWSHWLDTGLLPWWWRHDMETLSALLNEGLCRQCFKVYIRNLSSIHQCYRVFLLELSFLHLKFFNDFLDIWNLLTNGRCTEYALNKILVTLFRFGHTHQSVVCFIIFFQIMQLLIHISREPLGTGSTWIFTNGFPGPRVITCVKCAKAIRNFIWNIIT